MTNLVAPERQGRDERDAGLLHRGQNAFGPRSRLRRRVRQYIDTCSHRCHQTVCARWMDEDRFSPAVALFHERLKDAVRGRATVPARGSRVKLEAVRTFI